MTTAANYRISEIQNVTLNGKKCRLFSAYVRTGNCFVFVGRFSAPARMAKRDLWTVAASAE